MAFTKKTFDFLKQLSENNHRDWFENHRHLYEAHVRTPALDLISEMGPLLKKISPHFVAVPKKMGGSLMRIHRDTRFSRDKTPYKTNIGIQFRHEFGKDIHAPGFYLHVEPGSCFLGVGIWRPDSATLKKIRCHILQEPAAWRRSVRGKNFRSHFELAGESLKTAPLGFERDHPLIEDLRRKDFVGIQSIGESEVTQPELATCLADRFRQGKTLMRFLCDSIPAPF